MIDAHRVSALAPLLSFFFFVVLLIPCWELPHAFPFFLIHNDDAARWPLIVDGAIEGGLCIFYFCFILLCRCNDDLESSVVGFFLFYFSPEWVLSQYVYKEKKTTTDCTGVSTLQEALQWKSSSLADGGSQELSSSARCEKYTFSVECQKGCVLCVRDQWFLRASLSTCFVVRHIAPFSFFEHLMCVTTDRCVQDGCYTLGEKRIWPVAFYVCSIKYHKEALWSSLNLNLPFPPCSSLLHGKHHFLFFCF